MTHELLKNFTGWYKCWFYARFYVLLTNSISLCQELTCQKAFLCAKDILRASALSVSLYLMKKSCGRTRSFCKAYTCCISIWRLSQYGHLPIVYKPCFSLTLTGLFIELWPYLLHVSFFSEQELPLHPWPSRTTYNKVYSLTDKKVEQDPLKLAVMWLMSLAFSWSLALALA